MSEQDQKTFIAKSRVGARGGQGPRSLVEVQPDRAPTPIESARPQPRAVPARVVSTAEDRAAAPQEPAAEQAPRPWERPRSTEESPTDRLALALSRIEATTEGLEQRIVDRVVTELRGIVDGVARSALTATVLGDAIQTVLATELSEEDARRVATRLREEVARRRDGHTQAAAEAAAVPPEGAIFVEQTVEPEEAEVTSESLPPSTDEAQVSGWNALRASLSPSEPAALPPQSEGDAANETTAASSAGDGDGAAPDEDPAPPAEFAGDAVAPPPGDNEEGAVAQDQTEEDNPPAA